MGDALVWLAKSIGGLAILAAMVGIVWAIDHLVGVNVILGVAAVWLVLFIGRLAYYGFIEQS